LKRAAITLMPMPESYEKPSSTATDAEGKFAMAGLAPGRYRLSADKAGFLRTEYGAKENSQIGSIVTLGPGDEKKQLEIKLRPQGVITGTVSDDFGEPLAGASVMLMRLGYRQGRRELLPFGDATTNDLGEYRKFGLEPGRYYLMRPGHR